MPNIALVCGSFHREFIEQMLDHARQEAIKHELEVLEVVWVPGAMEIPLAIDRLLANEDVDGVCLLYTSPSPRDRQKSRMPSSA